jgi:hypothetical protein
MAIYRISVINYSRQTNSGAIAPHITYLGREAGAAQVHPETGMGIEVHVAHTRRERKNERPKDDLVATGHQNMPAWVGDDPVRYWQMADRYTRTNGNLAKEILLTLPKELDRQTNLTLVHHFLAQLPQHLPVSWAMHEPLNRAGDAPQPHAHLVISLKQHDGIARNALTWFRRHNPQQPEQGGARVSDYLGTPQSVREVRGQWKILLVATLREHGLTLEQPQDGIKELRLSWEEMRQLRRLLTRQAWGHEHRVRPSMITDWQQQGTITLRQATWLAQRGQRGLTKALTQEQSKVWAYTEALAEAKPWQLLGKRQARHDRQQAEATIYTLQQQQRALGQVYLTWLAPVLRHAQDRYREAKQQEGAQQQAWGHGRARRRGLARGTQEGVHAQLPTLDEALIRQQRQQQQGMER